MMSRTRTLITIHSGGLDVPANSRIYLEKACEQHPDIIEIDIRRTADNVAILNHDTCFPGSETEIFKLSLKEAKSLHPELLTLEEAIIICSGYPICINLDIKELGVIRIAVEVVKQNQSRCTFLFTGCGEPEVRELLSVYPGARVLYNVPPIDRASNPDYNSFVLDSIKKVEKLGCFGLNISHEDLQPEIMGYSRLHDIPVFVWTVDDRNTMRELIMMEVYSITTNKPDLLRKVIKNISSSKRKLVDIDWINDK